jgi:peptide/nickel transport system ATP-binding protein
MNELLKVRNLSVNYIIDRGVIRAVENVSFAINKGEKICLVGESGSGKSTVALALMKLLPKNAIIKSGEIIFKGTDLLTLNEDKMRQIRGKEIAIVFQNPLTSLNPLLTIGVQNSEPFEEHLKMEKKDAIQKAINMLKKVKLTDADKAVYRYPHTFSGGMRQRILIAMMLSLQPELLIADEPFSALDVSLQVELMHLLNELVKDFNSSLLFITHDLGVAAELCDRIIVMYAGKIVEEATVFDLFEKPKHPYAQGLLQSLPTIEKLNKRLVTLPGSPPSLLDPPKGCRFHPRCPYAMDICKKEEPQLIEIEPTHKVACWLYKSDTHETN